MSTAFAESLVAGHIPTCTPIANRGGADAFAVMAQDANPAHSHVATVRITDRGGQWHSHGDQRGQDANGLRARAFPSSFDIRFSG